MKRFTFLTFLTAAFLFSVLIMTSCTKEGAAGIDGVDGAVGPAGPQGQAGEDGIDGTDGTAGCILCHDGGEEQGMFTQVNQWEASVHATGGNFERNDEDCGTCHTSQGFLANLAGTYDGNVENPNPINCYTCHNIHKTFTPTDLAFTASDPVALKINGDVIDLGKGNLCANCHQPRLPEPMPAIGGGDFTITSPYWGAHHGPQSAVLAGTGLIEFEGSASLGINTHANFVEDGCVTCHMADAYGTQAGGHTMKMTYAYHGSDAVWVEGCMECHTDAGDLHNQIDKLQEEVKTLLAELASKLNDKGILAVGASRPTPGTYNSDVAAAFLNWAMIEEDRSEGVHNPQYVIGTLKNTIEALGGVFDSNILQAELATGSPIVDGIVDALWASVPELNIALGETNNPPTDPSKIGNCAGCHAFNSDVSVKLKATYDANNVYFLAEWDDPTASFTRGNSWNWDGTLWSRTDHTAQSEDRLAFFWPIGAISGSPYSTAGCMTKCHMYYPTDNDPNVSVHGIVDDAWLTSGRADMWHSKAARGAAYTNASSSGLSIDPVTFEVTAGTFSQLGFADDKYVDAWANDATNGEDGGRYGDAGTSGYAHNRIGDKSRPKYIEKSPTDYADAMTLTDIEISAGECVGDETTGVSDADAALYYPAYAALTAVVPERILRQPTGSRGDLNFGAVWNNGKWVAEFGRKLNTGNNDDIQFIDLSAEYLFNVAQFDNSRHGYEHRTSESYYLKFIQ